MNAKKGYAIAIILLTLITLALRLSISFQTATPSYDSYFALLQVSSIRETGFPLYETATNSYVFSPIYYYILAFFSFIMPLDWLMKILPNLFLVLLIPLIYFVSYNLSKNRHVSFAAAFFSAFAPSLFGSFLNESKPTTLALLLILLVIYSLTTSKDNSNLTILSTIVLVTISPIAWVLFGAYLLFFLMLKIEEIAIDEKFKDISIFTFVLLFWFTLITFKEIIFSHGSSIVWKSLPPSLLGAYFSELTYLSLIYAVGVIPIFLGLIAIYNNLFEHREKKIFLILALGLSAIIATLLRLLPLSASILLLSITFVLLGANGLKYTYNFLKKTKFDKLTIIIISFIVILFFLTSFFPAIVSGITQKVGPRAEELGAMYWLRDKTPEDSVILASPKEGFLINYAAKRTSVLDNNYLLINDAEKLILDADKVYTSRFKTPMVEITDQYSIDYVYLGPGAHERYDRFGILLDDECFKKVFDNKIVNIFEVKCSVR